MKLPRFEPAWVIAVCTQDVPYAQNPKLKNLVLCGHRGNIPILEFEVKRPEGTDDDAA